MREEQSVLDMVEEVLLRQARDLGAQTGELLESALETVGDTEAGPQLGALANSHFRFQRPAQWQTSLSSKRFEQRRFEQRHYSWLESYIGWLEGKELRAQYHAFLEEELASLRGWHS